MKQKQKKKYKYYQIYFWFIPEVAENFDDLLHYHMKEYLRELLNKDSRSFLSIPQSELKEFFGNGHVCKRVYVDKETHEKWKLYPKVIRKRIFYLVNKKLTEVLKNEQRSQSTR
ncbi:MAG: hypothetical protein JHC31_10435 [Sulfurihydrogenibium sp.]|nr:hypothetical protein [Sulfurihydrogenibium sp.]